MGPSPRFPESKDGTWSAVAFPDLVNFVNADKRLTISHFNMWRIFLSKRESGSSIGCPGKGGNWANGGGVGGRGEGRFLLIFSKTSLFISVIETF